jgi:hypothetical protein
VANELKKLKTAMDKEFTNFKNNQLNKSYKNLNDYLTDGGRVSPSSAAYQRRQANYNKFSTQWRDNLQTSGVASGKILPMYEQQIEKMYPELAVYMRQYPELRKIFRDAVTSPTPPSGAMLNAKLRGTTFWQSLTDSRVAYDTATEASKQQMVDTMNSKVVSISQGVGVSLDLNNPKVKDLSIQAIRGGWTDQMLSNAVGTMLLEDDETTVQLRTSFLGTQIQGTLNKWGYPTGGQGRQDFANEWVAKIATGQESQNTFETYLKNQAKTWFPSFADQFEAGRSFKEIVSPYEQIAASTLEKDPNDIDWSDPLYSQALNQGAEKNNAPMSFSDWTKKLRTDSAYGWNSTQQANDLARQIGMSLTRAFGKVR